MFYDWDYKYLEASAPNLRLLWPSSLAKWTLNGLKRYSGDPE